MLKKLYVAFGIAVITLYSVSVFAGWEFKKEKQHIAGPDMRSSSGGHIFIYSRYRGGK